MANEKIGAKADVIVRELTSDDIPHVIELQKESFPYMAKDGVIWREHHLRNHLEIFPEGQFCAELNGKIIASSSSLIVDLIPDYAEHTYNQITANGMFSNHNPSGNSLYAADVSTHPSTRRMGIATMLYNVRKQLTVKLGLRRIIAGGRLFNYCEYAKNMTPLEYAQKVVAGELRDPVLSFQLGNGFKFIKILPNYMKDSRSLNFASFIEWTNPGREQR